MSPQLDLIQWLLLDRVNILECKEPSWPGSCLSLLLSSPSLVTSPSCYTACGSHYCYWQMLPVFLPACGRAALPSSVGFSCQPVVSQASQVWPCNLLWLMQGKHRGSVCPPLWTVLEEAVCNVPCSLFLCTATANVLESACSTLSAWTPERTGRGAEPPTRPCWTLSWEEINLLCVCDPLIWGVVCYSKIS